MHSTHAMVRKQYDFYFVAVGLTQRLGEATHLLIKDLQRGSQERDVRAVLVAQRVDRGELDVPKVGQLSVSCAVRYMVYYLIVALYIGVADHLEQAARRSNFIE